MGIFSFLFGGGKYPTTSKYEAQLAQLKADFARYKQIESGNELKRLAELTKLTSSSDFVARVNKLKTEKFSSTEEYRKEQELKQLLKSSDYKDYLKLSGNGKAKQAESTLASVEYKEFDSLRKQVSSSTFMAKAKKEKDSAEAKALARFKQLKSNSAFKAAEKLVASEAYKNYKKIEGSDKLRKIDSLKQFVASPAFVSKKAELEDKNRFRKSDECKAIEELATLNKNADIKWYLSQKEKKTFVDADKWQLTFEEEFKGSRLDNKWLLGYYMGRKYSNVVYSLADERQNFVEKNAVVSGGSLDIQTRAGKSDGQVWNPHAGGFIKKTFDSTSALINTGDSFRQKFGKFEFKVKVSGAKNPVTHNVWLSSDKNSEINVATFGLAPKSIKLGSQVGNNRNYTTVNDVKFESDYYIYALTWTPNKLTWSVNGVEVYAQNVAVPQDEMYIGLSSNVVGDGEVGNADLNVEWVRVYTAK